MKKNSFYTIIIENIINKMIPANKINNMPKASEAIQIKKFAHKILKNKILKLNLDRVIYSIINNQSNYVLACKKILDTKSVATYIEKCLLESYFTSKLVQNKLSKRTGNFLKIDKNTDITKLVRLVKKSKLKYKKI